ncbi:Sugar-binding protein of ABC transporter system [Bifidobacterium breve JCM 7019]|uniref:substrate-binding domain-containing protein n=1 Tax=Bifidobacterium breve TaxID=1685 RepID=UPI0003EFC3F9|nr:substrate-binding domain-containing protein [Bifidobacterium breve]AHJ20182.1 Sugar-binding protein of ABC transporter system [Bifidobacterium breve JCM 7019]
MSAAVASLACIAMLAGCSNSTTSSESAEDTAASALEVAQKAIDDKVLSTGANGEEAASADVADLTDEEVQKIKDAHLKAALVFHYAGNDWYNAQVAGLKATFEELGVEIIATTDADFSPDKQVSDIETVLAQNPDIIISIPTDATATSAAYKKVAEAGVTLVFMDQPANDLEAGKDYVSVVSADNYGNGVASAHILANSIGKKGKIAALYHDADFFVTEQRYEGFKKTIEEEYPDIQIIAEKGVSDSDLVAQSQQQADAIINQNPDLAGMWAPWDVPAEGVMAAARSAGRNDLKITTIDLGESVGVAMAQNQLISGTSAQRPYDQGVTEAKIAAGARVLGKTYPTYVALSALPVTRTNLKKAWSEVYHSDLPSNIADLMKN